MPSLSTLGYMIENEPPNEQTLLSQCWEEKAFLAEKQHRRRSSMSQFIQCFVTLFRRGFFLDYYDPGEGGGSFPQFVATTI